MNKFDLRVNELLGEGLISAVGQAGIGAAKAGTAAVGSFLATAKNPADGVAKAIGDISSWMKKRNEKVEKLKGSALTNQNPPKVGSIVITSTPILGVSKQERNPKFEPDILKRKPNASPEEIQNASNEFLPTKVQVLMPNAIIYGKVTQKMNMQNSTYGVALTDERGNPSQKYVFAQTESEPFWQVYDASRTPEDDILIDEKGIPMKLTAIITGVTKNDVSDSIKRWVDYKDYLNQSKRQNINI